MKQIWEIWPENQDKQKEDFDKYLKDKKIKESKTTKEDIIGHIAKADHNLKFVKATIDLKEFNDWAIVSVYYAIYHAALSLCALKGFETKDHNATLLIIIKEFYNSNLNYLTKEEIELISLTTVEKEDVLYYVEAKTKRQSASYSTQSLFPHNEVEILRLKAIAFVNKAKTIIENLK